MTIDIMAVLERVKRLTAGGKFAEARKLVQQVLQLYLDDVDLITEYISLCYSMDDYTSSVPWIRRLRELMGGDLTPRHHMMMRHYIRRLADWQYYESEMKWVKNHLNEVLVQPFYLFSLPLKLSEHKKLMRALYRQKGWDKVPEKRFDFSNRSFQNRPIKIGFMSPNWRTHPEMSQTPTFYRLLNDSERFQVYFYDLTPLNKDDLPKKEKIVQISPKTFKNVAQMNDVQLANLIFFDQIDILVDVAGLTFGNKIGTFAHRPAPIQVSWLGYPETLCGLPGADYLIADSFVVPPNKKDEYDEKVLYLEPSYYPYDENGVSEQFNVTRAELNLPENAFVFVCAGQDYKLTPEYFQMWMRILKKIPNAVLWMYVVNQTLGENLRQEAEKNGVNPDRLVFFSYIEHQKYMSALKCADLMLDTQYVGGHTTASDALFAGVPVLTCPGERWVARVCGSILNAMELPELIAETPEQYEEKAVYWGTHPKELKNLKQKVAKQVKSGKFFDSQVYARKFEALCHEMIRQYEKNKKV